MGQPFVQLAPLSPGTSRTRFRALRRRTFPVALSDMSNLAGAMASREEEIAFLVMEQVLGADIRLADAGAGDKMPDGSWVYRNGQGRVGIVEITSPPATMLTDDDGHGQRLKPVPHHQQGSGTFPPASLPSRLATAA